MRKPSAFDSVSSVLTGLAKRLGLELMLQEAHLRRHWHEIVGEPVASHTRPDQIRYKKLHLVVESSVWLQQLIFLKPSLLEKINGAVGMPMIEDLVMRVGEVKDVKSETERVKGGEMAQAEPTPEAIAEAEALAAPVSDPDLRARFAQVIAGALDSRNPPRPHRGPSTEPTSTP
jgi:hypothetical protein